MKEEKLEEKKKENMLKEKIRCMRKERNRMRIDPEMRNQPPEKKRKISSKKFKTVHQPGKLMKHWMNGKREEDDTPYVDQQEGENNKIRITPEEEEKETETEDPQEEDAEENKNSIEQKTKPKETEIPHANDPEELQIHHMKR